MVTIRSYMNSILRIPLNGSPQQLTSLLALQQAFAQVCNALAPLVQQTRRWNRVTLHHLAYKQLRDQFPAIGSQMVCNAIYSVSRTSRLVFQHPASPFNLTRLGNRPLPQLRFTDSCPVYFDRHTLSIKPNQLSMYTLDGRMRFQLTLADDVMSLFGRSRLREVLLTQRADGQFVLSFVLSAKAEGADAELLDTDEAVIDVQANVPWPSYLNVEETT